jgi:Domain of unknown function (DUF4062)
MPAEPPRVFVSSTFEDLADYRDAVRDAILVAGAVPVLIEQEAAQGATISETSSRLLRESDAVLLVVGHRYGATEPKTRKSWVETEYEAAKRLNKPLLAFMAAEDAPWPPKFVDADRTRIEAFRQQVASDIVVQLFRNTDDLKRSVAHALARWVLATKKSAEPVASRTGNRREIRIVRLLLSSPGDVAEERDRVARAVFRFNQDSVEELGLFVKLVRWEDMAPQIGPKAQAVINKQIGPYHLFSGIMWNRFGTPTEIAASGTKEEFDAAVACWEGGGRPWITFYFCDRPANFTTPEQLDQKWRVLEFRAQLDDKGVVRAYQAAQEFEDKFFDDLKRITRVPEFIKLIEQDG